MAWNCIDRRKPYLEQEWMENFVKRSYQYVINFYCLFHSAFLLHLAAKGKQSFLLCRKYRPRYCRNNKKVYC